MEKLAYDIDIEISESELVADLFNMEYSDYDIIGIGTDTPFAIGYGNLVREVGSWKHGECKDMLLEVINLAMQLESTSRKCRYADFRGNYSEEDYEKIIAFCNRHGLAFFGWNNGKTNLHGYDLNSFHRGWADFPSDELNSIKKRHDFDLMCFAFMDINIFLYYVNMIYRDFLLFASLYTNKDFCDTLKYYGADVAYSPKKMAVGDDENLFKLPFSCSGCSFEKTLSIQNKKYVWSIRLYNKLSLAIYQLMMLFLSANNPDLIKKRLYIKDCTCCGTVFMSSTKQKRYCPNCSPQKMWNMKNR